MTTRIDGIIQNLHGTWEEAKVSHDSNAASGSSGPVPVPLRAFPEMADPRHLAFQVSDCIFKPGSKCVPPKEEEVTHTSLQVGDTIRLQPHVFDDFHNPVPAQPDTLKVAIKGQAGPESDEVLHCVAVTDRQRPSLETSQTT